MRPATLLLFGVLPVAVHAALIPGESNELNGQPAPAFSARPVNGGAIALKDHQGQIVLLNFFASWCPPCRAEIGQLSRLQKQYGAKGLRVIGLAVDALWTPETVGDVKPLTEKLAIPYPVALATESITNDYHFKGIPTTIVIGGDGHIAKTLYGYHDGKSLEALVQPLLRQRNIGDTTVRSPSGPKAR